MRRPSAVVWFASVGLVACAGVLLARQASRTLPPRPPSPAPVPSDAASALRNLPLTFERNDGQFAPHVRFAGVQSNGAIAIYDDGFSITNARTGMGPIAFTFVNASRGAARGAAPQRGRSHYFSGSDRARWHTDIPTFGRVRRDGLYPGIDVVYYGRGRQLEYDLVVRPGGDPRAVSLRIEGGRPRVDPSSGELVIQQGERELRQERPIVYQEVGEARRDVESRYVIATDGAVGIEVGAYDRTEDLVIDPVVVYSTYLAADDIAVDDAGRIYVTASTTSSSSRPGGSFLPPDLSPATSSFGTGTSGVYLARLAPTGVDLEFSTFISASFPTLYAPLQTPRIALDSRGGVIYVAGMDEGGTVPVTLGRVGPYPIRSFLIALSNDGSRIAWSRYVGESIETWHIAARPQGGVAVTGMVLERTGFHDPFGVPPAVGSGTVNSTWVLKIDSAGNASAPSYVGERIVTIPRGIGVGPDDEVTVVGETDQAGLPVTAGALRAAPTPGYFTGFRYTGFVTRFNPSHTGYEYSTYLGGSDGVTGATAVAVDDEGSAYVSGKTDASDFPSTAAPVGDCSSARCANLFVMKIGRSGALHFSRQLPSTAYWTAIAVTPGREPVVAFRTDNARLPLVSSVQPYYADVPPTGFDGDIGLMKFSADGARLLFSSYLGGSAGEYPIALRVDGAGDLYVQGRTSSVDFPVRGARRTTPLALSIPDNFLTKILMRAPARADFDADARTDVSIFRPSTGGWSIKSSRSNTTAAAVIIGQDGDVPAAADFDADGQADLAVFRPSSGKWQIRDSRTLQIRTIQWGGTTADIPAPADYDGDGRADIAVFRPSNGYWYILQSATNTPRYVQWGGTASDIPTAGDYDGDGRADIAFFRPSNGYWYLRRSTAGIQYVQWGGTAADVPAPGDYDGDGKTDVAFWRPSDNYWYIRLSATGAARYVRWGGVPTDVPVPGDYDQDGITDQAFFRPTDGYWYILQSRTRTARYVNLGTVGDIPIPSRR